MNLLDRVRTWLERPTRPAADPEDLRGQPPDDSAASTGLDRPLSATGPIAEPPGGDPPPSDPPEPPLR